MNDKAKYLLFKAKRSEIRQLSFGSLHLGQYALDIDLLRSFLELKCGDKLGRVYLKYTTS